MKTTITILLAFVAFASNAQLNSQANYIKKNYPEQYEKNIKVHAIEKWGNDFQMVVYSINQQSESLHSLIMTFEPSNTNILFQSVLKWSQSGYSDKNETIFRDMKTFEYNSALMLHCDWQMVKYEYDNQVKAKSSF